MYVHGVALYTVYSEVHVLFKSIFNIIIQAITSSTTGSDYIGQKISTFGKCSFVKILKLIMGRMVCVHVK